MSRFSKAEIEARGWIIVHESEERSVEIPNDQRRIEPASYRAEKLLDTGHLINEEAESIGLLLERISAFERGVDSMALAKQVEAEVPADIPLDEAGIVQRNVVIRKPSGEIDKISEAELATRQASGAIFTDEGMQSIFPTLDASAAQESKDILSREAEEVRTAQVPVEDAWNVQILNAGDSVDSPGQSGGSSLVVVPEEAGEPEDASEEATGSEPASEATPAALSLAAEKGVDLSQVEGSGAGGKITKPDVESHLNEE